MSTNSVCKLFKLCSICESMCLRESPLWFDPWPMLNPTFVAMMTSSLRFFTASPIISSDLPPV